MKKKTLRYTSLFIITALFLMAPRCGILGGQPPGEEPPQIDTKTPITLEYWRLWDDSDVLDEFIEEYTKDHKNITIEVKKVELKSGETIYDYQSRLIKLIADGAGPDMFMIHNDWLPYMQQQIVPIPSGMYSTKDYRDTFPNVVQEDFIKDNQIYAIPYYTDNLMLFYNTDIFSEKKIKQPPRTLQELVNIVPLLTEYDSRGRIVRSAVPLGVADGIPRSAEILTALMMQYGAVMTSEDKTKATFNLPAPGTNPPVFAAQEALVYYTQFANPNSPIYTYTDAQDTSGIRQLPSDIQAFGEGKAAIMIGYSYQIPNIQKFYPNLKFATAPLPQRQPQNPVTIANYWGETVSRTSLNPNEAWDFIKFMSSRSNQSKYFSITKHVPSNKDLLAKYEDKRYYGPVAEQVSYSKSWYRHNSPEVEDIFAQMINNVLKNKISPEIAVDSAVRDINEIT